MSCVMPDGAFRGGCDAITGDLRQAWSALDRAGKSLETKLAIYGDDGCRAHHEPIWNLRREITALRRKLETIEVEVRQMGTPVAPSRV